MPRNRLPEIEVPEETPFINDKFDRQSCVRTFLSLTKLYADSGCVIALNGNWGTGKTTFVRMLIQELKKSGGHPLYFNAWENDSVSDPLIALLSEMETLAPSSDKWNKVVANGGKIFISIITSLAKNFAKEKLGIDSETSDVGIDEASKIIKSEMDSFARQKTIFEEFKKSLQEYVIEKTAESYPVVFFIDELDRCNPKFAVKVLERIKHLFDIPNVIFVLSINKEQLGYAVQGYYGSSNIDAQNYLRRFIDIEYTLPQPNVDKLCDYMYEVHDFDSVFNGAGRIKYPYFESEKDSFLSMTKSLVSSSELDIRSIDKVFVHTRLTLLGFRENDYIVPDVFFLLCYLKIALPQLYKKILSSKLPSQKLLEEFEETLPPKLFRKEKYGDSSGRATFTVATFIVMYNLDKNCLEKENLYNDGKDKSIKLKTSIIDKETFDTAINWANERRHNGIIPLANLIRRVELLQSIKL